MTQTVSVPLWLLVLILAFAGVTFASHFLFPSVRWFFRLRLQRLVDTLNRRLDRPVEPFKLMRRQDWVVRLVYDPRVLEAVGEHAVEMGVPGEVALEEARTYAREIVPGFSALFYFGFAIRAARWLSNIFYHVRVGRIAEELSAVDKGASVVFVMNHRSNMDYVLVTWLVAGRTAISYAVGEWARVWPLSALIRAMGAYFIRRNSRNTLYRRVLARYVQMSTEEGSVQAMFPEGGLSQDGTVGPAKLGLLSYLWSGWEPGGRDIVFVPVGLAYDRVLEDALLVQALRTGERRFRPRILKLAWETLRIGFGRARGRKHLFGTAAAGFGAPISLAKFRSEGGDLEALATKLMAEVEAVVPVLSVPLVAASLSKGIPLEELIERLSLSGAVLKLPPAGTVQAKKDGTDLLRQRGILDDRGEPKPEMGDLLSFYAAPVLQKLSKSDLAP